MISPVDPQYPYRLQDGSQLKSVDVVDEEAAFSEPQPANPPSQPETSQRRESTTILMPPQDYPKKPRQTIFQRNRRCMVVSGVLLGIGLIVLIIGIACFHQIAQLFMNGAQLSFQSIKIQEPTHKSFQAAITGDIRNAGPFNARTQPMNVTILYSDVALGWMMLPAIDLKFGSATIDVTSEFTISNKTAFVEFSKNMLADQSFTWQLLGNTDIKVMGLVEAKNLVFDKKVQLAGMNNFPGVQVSNFNLEGQQVIAAEIGTSLDNKSPIQIEMGELTLDMYYQGSYVGRVNTTLDSLKYGLNPLNLTGSLVAPDITDQNATAKFSDMFSNFIQGKDSIVTCVGAGLVSKNGSVDWLVDSIRSLNISVVLPGGKDLQLITSLSIKGMDLNFNTGDQNTIGFQAANVTAGFKMPFNFPIEVLSSRQSIKIYDGNFHIASLNSDWTNSSNSIDASMINTSILPSILEITDDQMPLFSTFLVELFKTESQMYTFKGTADLIAKTPVGVLTLIGAPLNQNVSSKGFQGLNAIKQDGRTSNPVIHNSTVHRGLSDQILMTSWITLYSASDVTAHLGDINLALQFSGLHSGWTILRNLTIHPGDNIIEVECYLQPLDDNAKQVGMKVIERYLNGQPTETYMLGTSNNSTKIALLQDSVAKLELHAPLPGLTQRMVKSSTLQVNPFTVSFTKLAEASFQTFNPFLEVFTIESIIGVMYKGDDALGEIDVKLSPEDAIKVPVMQTLDTPNLPIQMKNPLSLKAIKALTQGLARNLDIKAVTHINASLGDFKLSIGYNDTAIPTFIKLTVK